jgi:hypothetical protein
MRATWFCAMFGRTARSLLFCAALCATALAQEALVVRVSSDPVKPSPLVQTALPEAPSPHRFWDRENRFLFVTVAALSAADLAVTHANLQDGAKELNPVTRLFGRTTAGLAANFAGETASVIGISYFFHQTGHHKLERITSMLDIGVSSFAVSYDLSQR